MEIKGKRILITCREDDSRPFYFLIKFFYNLLNSLK